MKRLLCLLLGIAFAGAACAGQEKAWHGIRGKELQALFADRDLGDGTHYAYQFHRGGHLTGMNMGKAARGTWKVTGQYLCWTWSKRASDEECYEVRQKGHEVRLFLDGYEAFSGTLTPIEPGTAKEMQP